MANVDSLFVALLAAGRSKRFGAGDKLAATLAGRPLIDWAADTGRAVDAVQHIVVTGPDMPPESCPAGYARLVNRGAEEGLASSLRLAARHAREGGASALLVLLADMPFVQASHLSRLIASFATNSAKPVFSQAPGNSAQPPAILPAVLFPTLEALSGDSGARSLARCATLVETPAETLIDVDTRADLALCVRLIGS